MSKKVAVILSGSGVFDGSEIYEAVLTLLSLDRKGASYQCFAPDISQHHVINHLTGEEMDESRNVLVEAARIARGEVKPLRELKADDFDALIIPGGFGAAKNLSGFCLQWQRTQSANWSQHGSERFFRSRKTCGDDVHCSSHGRSYFW